MTPAALRCELNSRLANQKPPNEARTSRPSKRIGARTAASVDVSVNAAGPITISYFHLDSRADAPAQADKGKWAIDVDIAFSKLGRR